MGYIFKLAYISDEREWKKKDIDCIIFNSYKKGKMYMWYAIREEKDLGDLEADHIEGESSQITLCTDTRDLILEHSVTFIVR